MLTFAKRTEGLKAYQPTATEPGLRPLTLNEAPESGVDVNVVSQVLAQVQLNRYPEPTYRELRNAVAAAVNTSPEQVFVEAGSSRIIGLLPRVLVDSGAGVVISTPTYEQYKVQSERAGARVIEVPRPEDLKFALDPVIAACRKENAALCFLCSPNNPTGDLIQKESIVALLRAFPGIVVVDEAYIDFARTESLVPLVSQEERLVVLRTLSKAGGLAGLRIGYCVAAPEIVKHLNAMADPFPIDSVSDKLAIHSLRDREGWNRRVAAVIEQRELLAAELSNATRVVEKIYPSEANFLLVKLTEFGFKIAVRDLQDLWYHKYFGFGAAAGRVRDQLPGCERCIRYTIGSPQDNDLLARAFLGIHLFGDTIG